MKKLLIGIVLSLICTPIFACHFYGGSICHTKAYFHGSFSPNSIFQFRFYGTDTTVVKQFVTGDRMGELDSIIIFDIPDGTTDVKISFRNHYLSDSLFNNWAGNYDAGDYYELIDTTNSACGILPVTVSNVQVIKSGYNMNVSFSGGDETNTKEYNILASSDGKNYIKIGTSIKATGAVKYSQSIDLRSILEFIPLLFVGIYNEEKKKKVYNKAKQWFTFIIFVSVFFMISCNKVKDIISKPPPNYTSVQIQTVNNDGGISYSETKPIRN